MSIFLNKDSKVIVQGITGAEATMHTARMLKAGTQLVGGVNARKAGTTVSHKDKDGKDIELPVFGIGRRGDEGDRRRRVGGVSCRRSSPRTRSSRPSTPRFRCWW